MKQQIYIEQLKKCSRPTAAALNSLLMQLDSEATALTEGDIRDMISSSATRLFVARRCSDHQIVGMVTMITYRIPYTKKGLLEDLVINKNHRRRGIGTKLITYAIDKARKENLVYLDFTSRPTRVAANKLYQRLGFEKRDTNVYRIKLYHAIEE